MPSTSLVSQTAVTGAGKGLAERLLVRGELIDTFSGPLLFFLDALKRGHGRHVFESGGVAYDLAARSDLPK